MRRGPTAGICDRCVPNPVAEVGGVPGLVRESVVGSNQSIGQYVEKEGPFWQAKLVRFSCDCLGGLLGSPISY